MIERIADLLVATFASGMGVLGLLLALLFNLTRMDFKRRRRGPRRVKAHMVPKNDEYVTLTPERARVRRARAMQMEAEAAREEAARQESLKAREDERRIALALIFVPPGQRERYRQEWNAEMASLSAREASAFALQLLWSAPRTGAMLWLKRTFGRRPA
ncbi:hypothetical protein OG592_44545 (plasmid) [Streptomyces avidinii]|uniref:hypothetical protein n=1 Tax=Streptomyces avidinii TaxID=1895 RepID=UPI00386428A4|nr:hypothetical protein OG592_44545 [Streptomyces avidinii]